ncbi:MAG: sigma-B regulation protein RsbU (phosphoserine phosphatase) [Vicingaceae bacterium]|jgi:sigma-B regulation protein RsbU (phosphoserine phosphatase)
MMDDKASRVRGKLQQSKTKLDTLLNITNAINNSFSKDSLFSLLQTVLTENLNIAKLALFTLNSDTWNISITKGVSAGVCDKIDVSYLIKSFPEIGIINRDEESKSLSQFDIAIPVFHHNKPFSFMLLADVDGEKLEISPIIKHLRFIQTLINIIVVALENKRLNEQEIKQAATNKELELARNMQTLLFPKSLPNTNLLKVSAVYLPHSEVGGDYYDVISLSNNRTALCIADVSGKGISAALLMANFQANLRALVRIAGNLNELIEFCNQKVIESANFQKFITLFIAIYDPNKRELSYVNCGHQPPLLIQEDGSSFLRTGSTVLGMFDQLPSLKTESLTIKKGDKLVCYTDGLTEMPDANGDQLEIEGIATMLKNKKSLEEVVNTLENCIHKNGKYGDIDDDITFLTAQFL